MYDVREDLLGQMTLQEKVALPCWYERMVHHSYTFFSYSPLRLSAQQIGLQ